METQNIISNENCEKVLENCLKSNNFKISNIKVESLADKVSGMMAEYYKLTIHAQFDNTNIVKHFFCKKLVMFHKIQEIMGKAQGSYEKEEYIYNFLIKECNKIPNFNVNFAPKCYLTIPYDNFVLEELIEQGYSIAKIKPDLKHCKLALETIAEYHASSIIFEEKQSQLLGCRYNLYDEAKNSLIYKDSLYRKEEGYLGTDWFKNCTNAVGKVIDLFPETALNRKEIKSKYFNIVAKVRDIVEPSQTFRNVCCHGDLSLVNILYKYENDNAVNCKIVDFQALRYVPPSHDVLTFLHLNTDRKFRDKHSNELLKFYYEALEKQLSRCDIDISTIISENEFRDSCKFVLPHVILQSALYFTMNPVIVLFPHIEQDQDLYKKYVYDDRSSECIKAFELSSYFREGIIDKIIELCSLENNF